MPSDNAQIPAAMIGSHGQPAASEPDDFVKSIQNDDFLQLVGVISNFAGVLGIFSTVTGVISFFEGVGQPDNGAILDAINQLQATLESDFLQLGDLITQQAQMTRDVVNRDTMALALANSDTAADSIQTFLSIGDTAALETAKTTSIEGFKFFINLNLTSPAELLFFLPGFVKAASIRLFVIASEPLKVREPHSVLAADINSMVALLTNMINSIVSTIEAAHIVVTKSHIVKCAVIAQIKEASQPAIGPPHRDVTVIDGYSHEERVTDNTTSPPTVSFTIFAFFDAQKGNPPCEQPSPYQAGALAAAQQARIQGVNDELAYMAVPYFQQVLQSWTNLLIAVSTPPITTVINLNGTWITRGAPGPVITVNGNAISIDMSVYKRPSAYGSIRDSADITVTFPDDNTYTAVLHPPGTIQWSNNTSWTKAK